jgi:hypothetical protein
LHFFFRFGEILIIFLKSFFLLFFVTCYFSLNYIYI